MQQLVIFVFCCVTVALAQRGSIIKWKREVVDRAGKPFFVTEQAVVNSATKTMLMQASDVNLRRTPIHRADSLHDFNTGLLALKPVGSDRCFIGRVKKSFEETLKDLRARASRGNPPTGRRTFETGSMANALRDSGSRLLNGFCEGRSMYQLTEQRATVKYGNPLDWTPFPVIYCFYGPIDIWYPVKDLAALDNSCKGSFAPSP